MNIDSLQKMVDKKLRSNETLKQRIATRKQIETFIKEVYKDVHLKIDETDYSFATKFYNYLTIDREPLLTHFAANLAVKCPIYYCITISFSLELNLPSVIFTTSPFFQY